MNDTISTREFSIDDYDAAVELWKRVEGLEIAEGDDKESVARFLTRNPGLSRVATDGSVIVGVSLCGHDGRRGHIYHLAVEPRYQGVGLGKRIEIRLPNFEMNNVAALCLQCSRLHQDFKRSLSPETRH